VSTAAPYDEIAEWYGEWIRDGALLHDFILPTVRDLVGDIRGQRVCDLACGQGIVARQLAGGGGAVVSDVDISSRLLELARSYEAENPAGIEYMWGDAQELPEIPDESFDGMVCNMALMNILSLPPTLDTVARILRPRGRSSSLSCTPASELQARSWPRMLPRTPPGRLAATIMKVSGVRMIPEVFGGK
jgi:ubiquinone/menaquinone biosynthesis C-methylase UbiE